MYEEFVRRLRELADEQMFDFERQTYLQAANVIEALQKLTDAQLDIIKQYQEQFSKTRWIPVTDHTPKYSGYYLVCDTDEHVHTAWFGNTTKQWRTEGVVTHWMMHPEPPKEES